jgi:AbrB family looped-hinge helix DNA binding protein
MDRAGRLVIPKEIRERAGLEPGTELDIRLDNGVVAILPVRPGGRLVEEDGHLFWEPTTQTSPITVEEINRAIQDLREERDEEILEGSVHAKDRTGL